MSRSRLTSRFTSFLTSFCAIAFTVGATAGVTAVAAPASTTEVSRPATANRWIVDPQGRAVIYHGENVVAKKAPYTPESIGFGEDDIVFLKQQGYNAVRLGIIWEAVEPTPGHYDDAYLSSIDKTIRQLSNAGIGTLLEVHQDAWSKKYGGEGAPEWASLDQGFPALPGGLIAAQFSPAVYQAVNNFFNNAPASDGVGIRTRFVDMWAHVAQKFATVPGIIGYSSINEPTPGWPFLLCQADLCPPQVTDRLRSLNADVTGAIRASDKTTSIWPMAYITTALGTHPNMGPPVDPNEVYPFNSYTLICNLGIDLPGFVCDPHQRLNAQRSREYAEKWNIPFAMTEFGAIGNPGVLRTQSSIADANMISWFHWSYGGPDHTTSAPSPEDQAIVIDPHQAPAGANVNWDNLRDIQRAYPQAIAGTPLRWGTDDRGTFTLTWSAERPARDGVFPAGSHSVVRIPPIAFPGGYTVQVTNGKVVSSDNAAELVIESGGQAPVSVTVTPREPVYRPTLLTSSDTARAR